MTAVDRMTVNEDVALQVLKIAMDLRNIVPAGSTVIFPGRSGLWIKQAFDFINAQDVTSKYKSIHFNFSGKPNHRQAFLPGKESSLYNNLITPARYEHFKKYLLASGIDLNDRNPQYIVDYIDTGESLYSLLKIMSRMYREHQQPMPDLSVVDISEPDLFTKQQHNYEKDIHPTSLGGHEFYFDPQGHSRISYFSLHVSAVNILQYLSNSSSRGGFEQTSLGYYYPAFRWKPEFDTERDTQKYKIAQKIDEGQRAVWENYKSTNGLQSLEFFQKHYPTMQSLKEVETFIFNLLQNGSNFYGSQFFDRVHLAHQGHNVSTIISKKRIPHPDEILVVFDVDGVLTHFSDKNDFKGADYYERAGAKNLLATVLDLGMQVVLSSAEPDLQESHKKLTQLGLGELLRLPAIGFVGVGMPFRHAGSDYVAFKLGNRFASVLVEGQFLGKGLAPLPLLGEKALAKIRHIVFIDDNKYYIRHFRRQMTSMARHYTNLQSVDYLHLEPNYLQK